MSPTHETCQVCKEKKKVCCSYFPNNSIGCYCYCADCCPYKREHLEVRAANESEEFKDEIFTEEQIQLIKDTIIETLRELGLLEGSSEDE